LVNVLERGEKIDDLVARSNDLSFEAKAFYKTVRQHSFNSFIRIDFFYFRHEKPIDVVLISNSTHIHIFPTT